MVSGSCACTSIGKPKSVGRSPLISRHDSPASSLRITSQCFCMYSTSGREGCMAMQWTQWPTSALGSGSSYLETSPFVTGRQDWPPSSLRNAPAAEIATNMRSLCLGSSTIVCRHMPPAPGCHSSPLAERSPGSSLQLLPPSVVLKIAASSTPAYTVSGSWSDGSSRQTRLNSHGCWVPSYHWCVPGVPSYANLFPTGSQLLPPSFERWTTCPNQP